jgi:hydrogenase expression/formation protein HypE
MPESITLAHGNGGRRMRELIEDLLAPALGSCELDVTGDAAVLPELPAGTPMLSTDAFTVQPLEFPGGDIGSLAVNGTVNDLAVCGARPLQLSLALIIEEGLDRALLARVMTSAGRAAAVAGCALVTGDTKVVPRGHGGGLYVTTTGLGVRRSHVRLGLDRIRAGDCLVVSGPVGDHGTAVMLAREEFGLSGDLASDCACVLPCTRAALALEGVRFMRDPTRGGLATVAHEIARGCGLGVRLREADVPLREPVRGVCEMLGYDPLYLACEGRVVAVVAEEAVGPLLAAWRRLPEAGAASLVGRVETGPPEVIFETTLGGERLLEELEDDPLPRIC